MFVGVAAQMVGASHSQSEGYGFYIPVRESENFLRLGLIRMRNFTRIFWWGKKFTGHG